MLTIYDKASGEAEETINLEKFNLEEVRQKPQNRNGPFPVRRLIVVVLDLWLQTNTRVAAETHETTGLVF